MATELTPWEAVHSTVSRYAVAVDTKNTEALGKIFTDDATADYTGPMSDLKGGQHIVGAVMAAVAKVDSQHAISTIVIDFQSPSTATSIAYFTATLFGKGDNQGKKVNIYGMYNDKLQKVDGAGWKIKTRQLSMMGPMSGDLGILG